MLRTKIRCAGALGSAAVCFVAITSLGLVGACRSKAPEPDAESKAVQTATARALPATRIEAPGARGAASVSKEAHGDVAGRGVERYTLRNENGLSLRVITYGAIITDLWVPDRTGKLADVVLGFDDLEDYVRGNPYFGAIVGRVANRIANARFELDGKQHTLAANDGPHHLHGGRRGWDKVVWEAEPFEVANGAALKLTYVSPDGEEGYPGKLTATTVYTLTNDDALRIEMSATADQTTLVNMAHHSYWNLAGHASGSIKDHVLQLFAAEYTPPDGLVPDGRIASVLGTPFDFTKPKAIGEALMAAGGSPIGFDHNFVVDGEPHQMRPVAKLRDPASGRTMTLEADQPGVQFYSGNFLDGKAVGKGGAVYAQYSGLCLETQRFPNSIHVPEWKNEVILSPGETYRHTMVHRFSVE